MAFHWQADDGPLIVVSVVKLLVKSSPLSIVTLVLESLLQDFSFQDDKSNSG